MEVIEAMKGGGNSFGLAAAIYEDCFFLSEHRSRESNMAAHVLASKADGLLDGVWQLDPPNLLMNVFMDGVNLLAK